MTIHHYLFIFILSFNIVACTKSDETTQKYDTIEVEKGSLQKTVSSTGSVTPKNRLEVKPPLAGRIEQLFVKEGQAVTKGQVLGYMSSTERVALIDAARSEGEAELKRWEEIYKPTPIVAAITGVVISRQVEPGQSVTLADVVVIIADRLIVRAYVDETDVALVTKDKTARIILDAYPNEQISGKVQQVAFESTKQDNVTVYEVEVNPDEVPTFMKSGMNAEVIFLVLEKPEALYLPLTAIQFDSQGAYVLAPADSGKTSLRIAVKTGIQDGKNMEISEGLSMNQKVLLPVVNLNKENNSKSANPFMPDRSRAGQRARGN